MKKTLISILLCSLLIGCKHELTQQAKPVFNDEQQTILEKIAHAHGYSAWPKISEIQFTFNVDRDSSHFERNWTWHPKSNHVVLKTAQDTIQYNRKISDSIIAKTDAGFTNDKYWLLAPFNLIWDKNITHRHTLNSVSPIAKKPMQKLTIVYGKDGGYTPGDAYDFYFEDDYLLKEWVFRKGNAKKPSLTTSWENYIDLNGLKIATSHKKDAGDWILYFTDLKVK